ncbi:MAG: 50S ribosomal protein L21 [Lentisphaerae bacterium]|nr:50S ribosomal protein L21 [Lentisphaerota bacterium]
MEAYAVVETGGKQYLVKPDDVIQVERLDAEAGKTFELEHVLAVSDGKALVLGTPEVSGAKVVSDVVEHIRGEKVVSFKKKRRKGYMRKQGHRQELTVLKITSIA